MKTIFSSIYTLILALWAGGISLFTFILTPVIFRSFGRDMAGEIVGKLFPGYFFYNLVLSAAALALYFMLSADRAAWAHRLSIFLLVTALILNLFIVFKLHPEAVKVKREISSFERESPDSAARKKFARLHAVSAGLNLFLLVEGITLLIIASAIQK